MIIQFFLGEGSSTPPPVPAPPEDIGLAKMRATLADLLARRGTSYTNGELPRQIIESVKGRIVPVSAFEPDPVTSRSKFYYNSMDNILYQRVYLEYKPRIGKIIAVWKRVSE